MFLKFNFYLLLLTYTLLSFGQEPIADSLVFWHERKLDWSDFTKKRGPLETLRGEAASACSVFCSFFVESGVLNYKIEAVFEKKRSWIIGIARDDLLAHEQLHFDIAELYARKIRKLVIEKSKEGYSTKLIKEDVDQLLLEMNQYHDQYDAETVHGAESIPQKEWQDKVFDTLNQLEKYSESQKVIDLSS